VTWSVAGLSTLTVAKEQLTVFWSEVTGIGLSATSLTNDECRRRSRVAT
jgi:hypothetical protein